MLGETSGASGLAAGGTYSQELVPGVLTSLPLPRMCVLCPGAVVGGEAQTLTKHFEPGGGLGGARCPRLHHAHIVALVAHLGLRQHQAPLGVQLVWGAAAPGVELFVPELGATQLGRGQAVAGP